MPQFSRNTIIEVVEALRFRTNDQIRRFAFKFGLDTIVLPELVEAKKTAIMEYLARNQGETGPMGSNLIVEIIEYIVQESLDAASRSYYGPAETFEERFPDLAHSLKRDGYIVEEGKLKTMLPEDVPLPEMENELEALLDKFGFAVAKGHYEQAVSAHTRGQWAAANAQMRSFIESLFDAIAHRLVDDKARLPKKSHGRRELLAGLTPPFLLPDLNEWEIGDRGGFVQGFWRRLCPEGSHPGLSDDEDSTFRLHIVILVASHYLRRLRDRIA